MIADLDKTAVKPRAYSYIRFSTPEQLKGDSLRRQTDGAAQWCERNGVELVESYRDLGISAFRGKNASTGALASFLQCARNGKIPKGSFLIVESLDRISRANLLIAFNLFAEIVQTGVKIVTLTDGHIYDGDGELGDTILSLVILARSNNESKEKSMRILKTWAQRRQNLANEKLTKKCPPWLRLSDDRKRWLLIPEKVAIVRKIFKLASEGLGQNRIVRRLRNEKIPFIGNSEFWHLGYVSKILNNRSVIGDFTPTARIEGVRKPLETIPDYYPAIIDKSLFATVQQLRKCRPSFKGRSSVNAFSHIAFDRETGTPLTLMSKNSKVQLAKGHVYRYLQPSIVLRKEGKWASWRYEQFLGAFLTLCKHIVLVKVEAGKSDNGLSLAQMELGDLQKKIDRLVEFLMDGENTDVRVKLQEMGSKKDELQARIAELENQAAARPMGPDTVNWEDTEKLRDNLRATVRRITVDSVARWFKVEFLNGMNAEYRENEDGTVSIRPKDHPLVLARKKSSR